MNFQGRQRSHTPTSKKSVTHQNSHFSAQKLVTNAPNEALNDNPFRVKSLQEKWHIYKEYPMLHPNPEPRLNRLSKRQALEKTSNAANDHEINPTNLNTALSPHHPDYTAHLINRNLLISSFYQRSPTQPFNKKKGALSPMSPTPFELSVRPLKKMVRCSEKTRTMRDRLGKARMARIRQYKKLDRLNRRKLKKLKSERNFLSHYRFFDRNNSAGLLSKTKNRYTHQRT